ncbi:helix-turn-helix domain-containing protein [Natrialbaceae archaeon AArc-T1-2]|uniref:helix-turn-helix domain-containing protein n=1 Tax=Natrialbaceae archaeon AArc-T1-2 TaxID=3053904 RepID=UPI00255AA7D4|nr:helix-turn-helix domain-containing protein [Natrialbaceae archaeon AArc-T1-2]WIV66820.1 helix-turn-helix domain-containing protein [Natrialbaceae archaeon AArc-T1-2]
MTTVVDIRLPARDTVMGSVFESVPEIGCEMEQVIAADGHRLWFTGADQSAIDSALETAPSVTSSTTILAGDDRWLYDVEFASDAVDVFSLLTEMHGTVLSASATDGTWTLQARFSDRKDVSRTYDTLLERGVSANLVRLTDLAEDVPSKHGLTTKQYETLVAAHDHGYFTIPRETSMEELADELDVSHQALSERLRRAYRCLVATELNTTERADSPSMHG